MTTNHFNRLTEAEQERLAILVEECGEVVQIGCKILRHGYESFNPTIPNPDTNREALEKELGHVLYILFTMVDRCDLDRTHIDCASSDKETSILRYLHHQPVF